MKFAHVELGALAVADKAVRRHDPLECVIVDPACGSGILLLACRALGWQGAILGMDIDPRSVAVAEEALGDYESIFLQSDFLLDYHAFLEDTRV